MRSFIAPSQVFCLINETEELTCLRYVPRCCWDSWYSASSVQHHGAKPRKLSITKNIIYYSHYFFTSFTARFNLKVWLGINISCNTLYVEHKNSLIMTTSEHIHRVLLILSTLYIHRASVAWQLKQLVWHMLVGRSYTWNDLNTYYNSEFSLS